MDIINKPIGWLLELFSGLLWNNYVLAILVIAVIFEIILLPFGIKQQKNSIKQARLRPKEMAIRKKYAGRDDKPTQQKMTQEIQELYQKEGYNPLSGCLPLLIQFPLLIAIYNVVIDPLKYICGLSSDAVSQISTILGNTTKGGGTMAMLNQIKALPYETFKNVEGFTEEIYNNMPNLSVFGFDLSISPMQCLNVESIKTVSGWLVLSVPILTFLAYFFSMKMSRKLSYQPATDQQAQMGCSNKMMDIMMPLFSVFISFGVPAALGVYWIFKSLIGVVKQVALYYAMPLPKFTEEDYKQAEKEMGTADKKTAKKSGRVVRSLHHIDDEDFEDTREEALKRKEALARQEEEDKAAQQAAAGKRKGLFGSIALKEDDRPEQKSEDDRSEQKTDDVKSEATQDIDEDKKD